MAGRMQVLTPWLRLSLRPATAGLTSSKPSTRLYQASSTSNSSRWLSTTPIPSAAKAAAKGPAKQLSRKKRQAMASQRDPRIIEMIKTLALNSQRKTPAPLRMGRNRHLRHWTIHRAWLLYRRQENARRQNELQRLYQSMQAACEELRKTSGPGDRGEGYLYRVAMEKAGVWGLEGIPIEYARPLTETPARVPWNHDWKRSQAG